MPASIHLIPTTAASPRYCSVKPRLRPPTPPDGPPGRMRLIAQNASKWLNGTTLTYYFFDEGRDGRWGQDAAGQPIWLPWAAPDEDHRDIVREAFQQWKDVGIGLSFREVAHREEAKIRIGFEPGDGAWSYVGRDILAFGPDDRTMNFGWSLTDVPGGPDTALHEIGHTLDFSHEHQNPFAGIEWDEDAVYASLAAPPNNWEPDKTYDNIIKKLSPQEVNGSHWDPDSIMHYPFEAGLIRKPPQYRNGLSPAGGLSPSDKEWVRTFYPPISHTDLPTLHPFEARRIENKAPTQQDFLIEPQVTRTYELRTLGTADTLIALFEQDGDDLRQIAEDDDSGDDRNALLRAELVAGRKYILRVKVNYAERTGNVAAILI